MIFEKRQNGLILPPLKTNESKMKKILLIFVFTYHLVSSQCTWQPIGLSQDSSFFNQMSTTWETNTYAFSKTPVVFDDKTGSVYRLYSSNYNNQYLPKARPDQVLQLKNNKWQKLNMIGYPFGNSTNLFMQTDGVGAPCVSALQSYGGNYVPTMARYQNGYWATLSVSEFSIQGVAFYKFAFDTLNTPYLVYSAKNDSSRLSVKKYNGTSWVSLGNLKFSDKVNSISEFDFIIDNTLKPWVIYNTKTGLTNYTKVYSLFGNTWQTTFSATSHSVNPDIFIKADNNNNIYCYYNSLNNLHTIAACSVTNNGVVLTYTNISRSKFGFRFDETNQLIAYRAECNWPSSALMQYFYYFNNKWMNISPGIYHDPNYPFLPYTDKFGNYYLQYSESSDRNYTSTLIKYDTLVKHWSVVGDGESGILSSRSWNSVIKTAKNGDIYVCYSDLADSGKVSVIKYHNNSWTYVGHRGVSENECYIWYFELDNYDVPHIIYRNAINSAQLDEVIVRKFNGTEWQRLGNKTIRDFWSYTGKCYPKLFFDKFNVPFMIFQGNYDDYLYNFYNNEWTLLPLKNKYGILSNQSLTEYGEASERRVIRDTNNTFIVFNSLTKIATIANDSISFHAISYPSNKYLSYLIDFKMNPATHVPYLLYEESGLDKPIVKVACLVNNKWVQVGNSDFIYNQKTGQRTVFYTIDYCSSKIIFDSNGNPFILSNAPYDSSKVTVYSLKDNRWQMAGNTFVSFIPGVAYDASISDNKIRCLITNKGATLKQITLPSLINIKQYPLDTCYGKKVNISVNRTDATSYVWQVNKGDGFTNISNESIYTIASSTELQINTTLSDLSKFKYRCIVSDDCFSDTTNIITLSCQFLDSIKAIPELVAFPNPAKTFVTIDAKTEIYSAQIFDSMGRLVLSYDCNSNCPTRIYFNLATLQVGFYSVKVKYQGSTKVFKLIKSFD